MKLIPRWALKKQASLKTPKFRIGDIVLVDLSKEEYMDHFPSGLGVITEQSQIQDETDYSIDFGPRKGESSWYPESSMTLLRSSTKCPECAGTKKHLSIRHHNLVEIDCQLCKSSKTNR